MNLINPDSIEGIINHFANHLKEALATGKVTADVPVESIVEVAPSNGVPTSGKTISVELAAPKGFSKTFKVVWPLSILLPGPHISICPKLLLFC